MSQDYDDIDYRPTDFEVKLNNTEYVCVGESNNIIYNTRHKTRNIIKIFRDKALAEYGIR